MSKSDTPLQKLNLETAYKPQRSPEFADNTPINGLDSETADGHIFMISYRMHDRDSAGTVHNNGEFLEPIHIWRVLTNRSLRSAINVWYNLDFDASVVLSNLFGSDALTELSVTGSVGNVDDGDEYEITYIPGKFMKIKDRSGHLYYHYDASQFFYTSLDNAAEEWLGENKTEGVDTSKFGKFIGPLEKGENRRVNDYISNRFEKINEYAKQDADLVYRLWNEATRVGEDLGIPMGKPFSTGYLGEQYMNAHLREKPGVGPYDMAALAWDSYAGGRFEVYERGAVGDVVGLDINSAYPFQLANLPDPKTLIWEHDPDASFARIADADYGFVRATVTTDATRRIQPFAIKHDDIVTYPAVTDTEITSIKDIFEYAVNERIVTDFEIHDAWLGFEGDGAHFPFSFIYDLYDKRNEYKDRGLKKRAELLKIILNSMYGKMCQVTIKRKALTDTYETEPYEQFVGTMGLPDSIIEKYPDGIIERYQVGSYFNPFLASYITGRTRLLLHQSVVDHGLEDETVLLATDCAMMHRDAYESSDFDSLFGDQLGEWDYEYQGRAFVIGAGVYEVVTPSGIKLATRGFREAEMKHGIQAELLKNDGTLNVANERPVSIAEAMWLGESADDVGVFRNFNRTISPEMDSKREWPDLPDGFNTLLTESQYGKPLQIENETK